MRKIFEVSVVCFALFIGGIIPNQSRAAGAAGVAIAIEGIEKLANAWKSFVESLPALFSGLDTLECRSARDDLEAFLAPLMDLVASKRILSLQLNRFADRPTEASWSLVRASTMTVGTGVETLSSTIQENRKSFVKTPAIVRSFGDIRVSLEGRKLGIVRDLNDMNADVRPAEIPTQDTDIQKLRSVAVQLDTEVKVLETSMEVLAEHISTACKNH